MCSDVPVSVISLLGFVIAPTCGRSYPLLVRASVTSYVVMFLTLILGADGIDELWSIIEGLP